MFEKELIIMPDRKFGSKEEVIRYLTHLDNSRVLDADAYEKAVLEREAAFVTYVGYGIGMPHAKTEAVAEPFAVYARLANEVQWGEDEGETVSQIFLLGVPAGKNTDASFANLHLKMLAMLSRHLMHEDFRNRLENAADAEEIYQILKNLKEE